MLNELIPQTIKELRFLIDKFNSLSEERVKNDSLLVEFILVEMTRCQDLIDNAKDVINKGKAILEQNGYGVMRGMDEFQNGETRNFFTALHRKEC